MFKTDNWNYYVRTQPILAVELETVTYVTLHGIKLKGKEGDYLCSNKERTEQWIVKPNNFHTLYKLIFTKTKNDYKTWKLYGEKLPIKAKQLKTRMTLQNKEIREIGHKGDYLCSNNKGIQWILSQQIMNNDYKQLTRKNSFCW